MHIGYLTPEYVKDGAYDGGLANYIAKVSGQLTLLGHKVTIFVSSDRNHSWMDGKNSIIEFKRKTLNSKKFLGRFNVLLPVLSILMTDMEFKKQVLKIHNITPFDLVQASSYMAPGYALRHNSIFPLVCRVSSYTPQLRSSFGYQRNFGDYLVDWLEIRQTLDADASFSPSIFLSETYRKLEGFKPYVIRTPLALDSIEDDDSVYQDNFQNFPYLLYFGTLSQIKGVDFIAEVIPDILTKFPSIHFVFIGRDDGIPGKKNVFDYVLANNPLNKNRLHYLPAISKQKLYPVIKHATGVVMPSRVDNYPNACLEALSCGVPVVATDQSSLEEMIIEGQTGFLAKNSDTSSIQDAVERLLVLSETDRLLLQKNISTWISDLKSEDRIGQLIRFYEEVILNWQKSK